MSDLKFAFRQLLKNPGFTAVAVRSVGVALLLAVVMVYPFLPGRHDAVAMTLSGMVQGLGAIGLLVVPIGMLWLGYEWRKQTRARRNLPHSARAFWFALVSLVVAVIPMLGLTLGALASIGLSLALPTLALWCLAVGILIPKLKRLKSAEPASFNPAPLYLTLIPIILSLTQFILARPLADFSRNRAMASAEPLIRQIEQHRANFGRYPASLLSVNKDYSASVVGIEKFHYAPWGEAYNLFFEQPRFIFDDVGTREFVVYNKLDQHLIPSHAAWVLEWSVEQLAANQGWYAVRETSEHHWRSFLFD